MNDELDSNISIPIHDILHSESSSLDLDFSLLYKNQKFNFNSTYLASISQTIRNLFISDPLAFQYDLNIQVKNKMKDIINILSNSTFQVTNSNYADCFNLVIKLRCDYLFSFIWNQIGSKLKKKEILQYCVLAYNNGIEIPKSLLSRLAELFQRLFISGLVTEITPDESLALSLIEADADQEYHDQISKEPPKYVGINDSFGPTPPGLVYLIVKEYPSHMISSIKSAIINRYVNQQGKNPKNTFLIQYDDYNDSTVNLIDSFKSNINNIRFVLDSLDSKKKMQDNPCYFYPHFTVPCNRIFDYYNNYNGIIKTSLRPIIKAPKSLSPEYPLMNILIYDDSRKSNSFSPAKSYISQEEEDNFIEFDFSPNSIKLSSFIMIDPPESWELRGFDSQTPDNYDHWILIDKHISNSNSEKQNIVYKDVKNFNIYCQKFKLLQPKDTSFQFSLNFIDFFGSVQH